MRRQSILVLAVMMLLLGLPRSIVKDCLILQGLGGVMVRKKNNS